METEIAGLADLYARAWPRLVGLLVSIGGAAADAEEVAQDAFERLLKAWDKVSDYEDPEAWLRTVAVGTLISRHRRSWVALRMLFKLTEPDRASNHAPASDDRIDLAKAMESLTVEQRAVVLLHYVCDLPVEAIASELRTPVGTVKSRLARGRNVLAPLLKTKEAPDHA